MVNPKKVIEAVDRLGSLAMFPSSPGARAEIMALLERMVVNDTQLDWLVRTMIDHVGTWHGPKELRAVLCTRFRPADGIEEYSALPGFTPADIESSNREKAVPVLYGAADAKLLGDVAQAVKRKRLT